MYRLRLKTPQGNQVPIANLNSSSSLKELRDEICKLTAIGNSRQKILIGYPPKPVTEDEGATLQSVGLNDGEMIIVEEISSSEAGDKALQRTQGIKPATEKTDPHPAFRNAEIHESAPQHSLSMGSLDDMPRGILLRKNVPSDNSCLFASLYYLLNGGGEVNPSHIQEMRQMVASVISSQPDIYNEAILEQPNSSYCKWILKETSWGGAIELSALSEAYGLEIVAIDTKTGVLNRFGEDKGFGKRVILMYDGIHYDPVYLETYEGHMVSVFPTNDDTILQQALELGIEAKKSGHFTDTRSFMLKCKDCGQILRGELQATTHAKETSHSRFEEVHSN